jgi:hypothetical protein
MNRFSLLLITLFVMLVPALTWGADGDDASDDFLFPIQITSGKPNFSQRVFYLCENKAAGSGTCADLDLRKLSSSLGQSSGAIPVTMVLEIVANTACSGTTNVDIDTHSDVAGGIEHDVVVLSSTETRAVVDLGPAMVGRFLDVDLTNMTACTDFDVLAWFFWR